MNFQKYPAEAPLKTCPEESPMKACPEEETVEAWVPRPRALQPEAEHRRHLSMQMRNVNSD